jgi:hypothetical protein
MIPGQRVLILVYDDAFLPSVAQSTTHAYVKAQHGDVLSLTRARGVVFGDFDAPAELYLDMKASGIVIKDWETEETLFDSRTGTRRP